MKWLLIEVRPYVFIDTISAPVYQDQGDEDGKDHNPFQVLTVTIETLSAISVTDFRSVRHFEVKSEK